MPAVYESTLWIAQQFLLAESRLAPRAARRLGDWPTSRWRVTGLLAPLVSLGSRAGFAREDRQNSGRQMLVKLIPEKWHDRGVQIIDTPRVWPVLVALMRARTQVLAL